jgi:hypothetical protein
MERGLGQFQSDHVVTRTFFFSRLDHLNINETTTIHSNVHDVSQIKQED